MSPPTPQRSSGQDGEKIASVKSSTDHGTESHPSDQTYSQNCQESTLFKFRATSMEYAAEFFGTMVLVIFGIGANCQVILGSSPSVAGFTGGNWTSLSLGWAAAVSLGVWVSGGHINPAVTLALATWRTFPWRKVPGYILSQLLGGIVGAAIVYGIYAHAIDLFEGGTGLRTMKTAGLFGTVPASYLPPATAFFAEFLATAMLLFGVLAFTDPNNKSHLPPPVLPGGIFVLVLGIAACLGMQTGFALNPARDLGPRMLTAMVGYGGQVFTVRNHYWIWCPVIATICGAQMGTLAYDLFLHKGDGGLINKLLGRDPQGENNSGRAGGGASARV